MEIKAGSLFEHLFTKTTPCQIASLFTGLMFDLKSESACKLPVILLYCVPHILQSYCQLILFWWPETFNNGVRIKHRQNFNHKLKLFSFLYTGI